MFSLNKVQLIGNLGADAEIRTTNGGTKVANLSLATNEVWKDRDGEKQERTEWHRVVFFGPAAELIEKYTAKGNRIYVEGKIRTEKWTDKEGQDRYTTEIRGSKVGFLDGAKAGETYPADGADTPGDDDIPF